MLPPHLRVGTENPLVMEGMMLCFGKIIDGFGGSGIEGALLLFLASIVYRADTFLLPQIANNQQQESSILEHPTTQPTRASETIVGTCNT